MQQLAVEPVELVQSKRAPAAVDPLKTKAARASAGLNVQPCLGRRQTSRVM